MEGMRTDEEREREKTGENERERSRTASGNDQRESAPKRTENHRCWEVAALYGGDDEADRALEGANESSV